MDSLLRGLVPGPRSPSLFPEVKGCMVAAYLHLVASLPNVADICSGENFGWGHGGRETEHLSVWTPIMELVKSTEELPQRGRPVLCVRPHM